jgi:uncharacterized membrane protein
MPRNLFTEEEIRAIESAIAKAEQQTSGEIRLFVDLRCKGEVMDRAVWVFRRLKMHRTKERNGVLFYIALNDRKFAILGDSGINTKVQADFWNHIRDEMTSYLKSGEHVKALCNGIEKACIALAEHFPLKSDDRNELSNEISFGS